MKVSDVVPRGHTGPAFQFGDDRAGEPGGGAVVVISLPSVEVAAPYGTVPFFNRIPSERGLELLRFLGDDAGQTMSSFPPPRDWDGCRRKPTPVGRCSMRVLVTHALRQLVQILWP